MLRREIIDKSINRQYLDDFTNFSKRIIGVSTSIDISTKYPGIFIHAWHNLWMQWAQGGSPKLRREIGHYLDTYLVVWGTSYYDLLFSDDTCFWERSNCMARIRPVRSWPILGVPTLAQVEAARPLLFCNLPWCWVSLVLPQCLGLFRHGNLVIPQVSRSGNAYWKWEKSVPLSHLFMLDCMEWTRKEIFWKWQSLLLLISSTMWQSYWLSFLVNTWKWCCGWAPVCPPHVTHSNYIVYIAYFRFTAFLMSTRFFIKVGNFSSYTILTLIKCLILLMD